MPEPPDDERWNHNIHYHRWLLAQVPAGARDVLDVGCGEGQLARRLIRCVPHVVGIDADARGIAAARVASSLEIEFVHDDVMTHPFAPASFDAVVSVATLHHLDAGAALRRLRALVRPGGVLAVVGLARSHGPADLPWELGAVLAHRYLSLRHRVWEHPSPTVWPPPLTYRQVRDVADDVLPGNRFRRRLLWRYTLSWRKPI